MIKFILSDEESLARYLKGEFPELSDVKRRMVRCARKTDFHRTDSQFQLQTALAFEGISSIPAIFATGLSKIANEHLHVQGTRLYVREDMQNSYQELMPLLTPLLLQAYCLESKFPISGGHKQYYEQYILPNSRFTAILSPKILPIDNLINDNQGLMDLHIHLNGSMETDLVWQDFLREPDKAYDKFYKAFNNELVKSQIEQETTLLDAKQYLSLLKMARQLRVFFYDFLIENTEELRSLQPDEAIKHIIEEKKNNSSDYCHPFLALLNFSDPYEHIMSVECMMYILIIKTLKTHGNLTLAYFFHFYLLILGLTNRLLVQQIHQYGFEQFKKNTVNKLRDYSEQKYLRRYFQYHGNDLRNLRWLEGRIAPKDTEAELTLLIDTIYQGWEEMKTKAQIDIHRTPPPFTNPELKLIIHFIKLPEENIDCIIRHKGLRLKLAKQCKAIAQLLLKHSNYKKKIVGLDAASSEFDTPPEVFAPSFRAIPRTVIAQRTFHAGEDFLHLVSGLRAIFEAILFCGLSKGDRIGHAVAAGISSKHWVRHTGKKMLISKGEYLDNLVFSRHLIKEQNITSLRSNLKKIEEKATTIIKEIYGEGFTMDEYQESWLLRDLCPRHAFPEKDKEAENIRSFSQQEREYFLDRKISYVSKAFQLFKSYHDRHYRSLQDKIIQIVTEDLLDHKAMKALQLALLKMMSEKNIAIETLPTSNVRIGIHRDFATYHLAHWLNWSNQGESIPKIIVGSDDTGIFATNIYNEYANIYCLFGEEHQWDEARRTALMHTLYTNGETLKFA